MDVINPLGQFGGAHTWTSTCTRYFRGLNANSHQLKILLPYSLIKSFSHTLTFWKSSAYARVRAPLIFTRPEDSWPFWSNKIIWMICTSGYPQEDAQLGSFMPLPRHIKKPGHPTQLLGFHHEEGQKQRRNQDPTHLTEPLRFQWLACKSSLRCPKNQSHISRCIAKAGFWAERHELDLLTQLPFPSVSYCLDWAMGCWSRLNARDFSSVIS